MIISMHYYIQLIDINITSNATNFMRAFENQIFIFFIGKNKLLRVIRNKVHNKGKLISLRSLSAALNHIRVREDNRISNLIKEIHDRSLHERRCTNY